MADFDWECADIVLRFMIGGIASLASLGYLIYWEI